MREALRTLKKHGVRSIIHSCPLMSVLMWLGGKNKLLASLIK
jgi:hypothetical protein